MVFAGRGRFRAAVAFCVAVLVAALLPAGAGARTVIAPKDGQRMESSPVRISLKAPWGIDRLQVRLNGRSVSKEFDAANPDLDGRRCVKVGASHGLLYGRNVLSVAKSRFGEKAKHERTEFRLVRERPLVGAGRDRKIGIGEAIRLNGRASRGLDAPRGRSDRAYEPPGSPAGLEMEWQLVRRPAGSRAELTDYPSGVQPSDAEIEDLPDPGSQPARPRLVPDLPGTYVAKLVVSDGSVSSVADRVATTAVLPTPLVPVDTAATVGGQRGIAVGYHPAQQGARAPEGADEMFFPLGEGNALQLVVLGRRTLETIDTWSGPPTAGSVEELTDRLSALDDSKLAIVTAWQANWDFPATDALVNHAGEGVNLIGARELSVREIFAYGLTPNPFEPQQRGQQSWVGVPGFSPGDAWETGGLANPGLRGFLSPDDNDNYAYLGPDPMAFDLGPDGQTVSVQVGEQSFEGSLPAGEGGFLAVFLDARTGQPVDLEDLPQGPATYPTRNGDGTPDFDGMNRLIDDLVTAGDSGHPLLVAVRSIGASPLAKMPNQPPGYEGEFDQFYAAAVDELAVGIIGIGGHGQAIWGMSTEPKAQDSYSLVGSNRAALDSVSTEGSGEDAGSQIGPGGPTRLSGILAQDHASRYVPQMTDDAPPDPDLIQTALAEPSEWPYPSTPGEESAFTCISQAVGLGSNPRVAYWNQTYSDTVWSQKQEAIANLSPSACPGADPADFARMKQNLGQEIGWLIQVHSYLDALAAPFTEDGLKSYSDLTSIATDVTRVLNEEATGPQPGAEVDPMAIVADLAAIVGTFEIPGEGEAVMAKVAGSISSSFLLMSDLNTVGEGNGTTFDWRDSVALATANEESNLADTMTDIAEMRDHVADIIVADYEKLRTVGTLGQCTPAADPDPDCPVAWQFTQDQQNAASRMFEVSAKRQIWGAIMPAAYPWVLRVNSNPETFDGDFEGPQEDIGSVECSFYPVFQKENETLESPRAIRYGIRQVQNTNFLVYSLENFESDGDTPAAMFPDEGELDPLFQPLDPDGDPDRGGLGLDPYSFMIDNWSPQGMVADWVGC